MEDTFLLFKETLERIHTQETNRKKRYCIKSAIHSFETVYETLTDGLQDPDKWYEDTIMSSRMIKDIMPLLCLNSVLRYPQPLPEENLLTDLE